jgi:hypothetical protein
MEGRTMMLGSNYLGLTGERVRRGARRSAYGTALTGSRLMKHDPPAPELGRIAAWLGRGRARLRPAAGQLAASGISPPTR